MDGRYHTPWTLNWNSYMFMYLVLFCSMHHFLCVCSFASPQKRLKALENGNLIGENIQVKSLLCSHALCPNKCWCSSNIAVVVAWLYDSAIFMILYVVAVPRLLTCQCFIHCFNDWRCCWNIQWENTLHSVPSGTYLIDESKLQYW